VYVELAEDLFAVIESTFQEDRPYPQKTKTIFAFSFPVTLPFSS